MQISVNADMKSTTKTILRQKTPEITQSWSHQFWISIVKHNDLTLQYEKTSTSNMDEKNPIQNPKQLEPSKQGSKREAVASFVHLCVNNV